MSDTSSEAPQETSIPPSQPSVPTVPVPARNRFETLLCSPWFDKLIGIPWVAYNVYYLVLAITSKSGLPLVINLAMAPLHNVLILTRRSPKRFAINPLYMVIGFLGGNWKIVYALIPAQNGFKCIRDEIDQALLVAAVLLWIWARISLGRNLGMLPAQRELVTRGSYQWIRHPFYTADFAIGLSYVLSNFTSVIFGLWICGIAIVVVKALLEERFLAADPVYKAYMERVRHRFIPGIV